MPNGEIHRPMKLDKRLLRLEPDIRRDLEQQFADILNRWESQNADSQRPAKKSDVRRSGGQKHLRDPQERRQGVCRCGARQQQSAEESPKE
jgi:hypothetical protein